MALLYLEYDTLTRQYPGWSLTEMKRMASRERKFWMDLVRWRSERETL